MKTSKLLLLWLATYLIAVLSAGLFFGCSNLFSFGMSLSRAATQFLQAALIACIVVSLPAFVASIPAFFATLVICRKYLLGHRYRVWFAAFAGIGIAFGICLGVGFVQIGGPPAKSLKDYGAFGLTGAAVGFIASIFITPIWYRFGASCL